MGLYESKNKEDLLSNMDKFLTRNIVLLMAILVMCVGVLSYVLFSGNKNLDSTNKMVDHTYQVITAVQQLSTFIEGMLSSQRGYIITRQEGFFLEFDARKKAVTDIITVLQQITLDNPAQSHRLEQLRRNFNEFCVLLEERAQSSVDPRETLINATQLNTLKNNMVQINDNILQEEYVLLNQRISDLQDQRSRYINTLFGGIVLIFALVLAFNIFLWRSQSQMLKAEQSLKESEERFSLVIQGTNDGVYDWDILTNKVFYSAQFFRMLGYNRDSFTGTLDDFKALLHPEDEPKLFQYIESYLNGELLDYSTAFRMRGADGKWVWINSRGKAIYDRVGRAVRMVGSHSDITFLKEYQEKLKDEKQAAEKANRAKGDFLAHMSHEIRTPLTAISGIAEIFERNTTNLDAKQKQLVRTLNTSTASLKDLVNDILDFSKIESAELELELKPFELSDVFQQVISIMSLRAHEKGLQFTMDYKAIEKIVFLGDPARLRQILINLVGNAIKFTDKGGITVIAAIDYIYEKKFLRVDVKDTGIGIADDNLDLIFERFKQADSSVARKYGGTGLGLAISRNLSHMMGGSISVDSHPGKGSTFTLHIPLRLADEGTEEEDKALSRKLNDRVRASINTQSKILLVEDYEGNIVVVSYILDELGCAYDIARTGVEAVDLWRENHYDLVLMDIQMPEKDGFTATAEIRALEKEKALPHTPIIGMTAHALVGDKDKCIDAGMDAYLPKPIVEADLKFQILKYIQEKKSVA